MFLFHMEEKKKKKKEKGWNYFIFENLKLSKGYVCMFTYTSHDKKNNIFPIVLWLFWK